MRLAPNASSFPLCIDKPVTAALALVLICAGLFSAPVLAAKQDGGQWTVFFVNHQFNSPWAASFQAENRLADNMSSFDELILKPAGYYRLNQVWNLGAGFKYQKKDNRANERDIWQEVFITPESNSQFDWMHQVRLEQRFVGGVDGVIPRLRYLLHVAHPLGTSGKRYLVAQNATRFNLASNDTGPPDGFEQNRLYFGLGFHALPTMRFEIGYLWRFQRQRNASDTNDHVLRLQFLFDTKSRPPSHAGS